MPTVDRFRQALDLAKAERQGRNGTARPSVVAAAAAALAVEPRPARPIPAAPRPANKTQPTPPAPTPMPVRRAAGRGRTKAELLPSLPTVKLDHEALRESGLLLPGLDGPAAHGFRVLRTQVLKRLRPRNWNSVAVVSPAREEGKTFTAINLAIAISATAGARALIVDLDLRAPSVARRLGFRPRVGIEACLRGEARVEKAIVRADCYPGLMVLPAAKPADNSSELLTSARAERLFALLKRMSAAQVVIFDLPPVLGSDDALAFLPHADAALVVVGDGRTERRNLLRCLELMRDVPVLGTVLNGSRREQSGEYAY